MKNLFFFLIGILIWGKSSAIKSDFKFEKKNNHDKLTTVSQGDCVFESKEQNPCDTILLTNGEIIICKVKSVTSKVIEYYKCGYVSGSIELRKKMYQ